MAYEMVMPYHLHMPSYFLETFTEYPELEQPIYVKPNRGDAYEFDSGEWKTVSGEFRMFFHIILLIYREILHVIRNG